MLVAAARAIVIPHDGRFNIYEEYLSMFDGGLTSLADLVEGAPIEIPIQQRRSVVVFVADGGAELGLPRNLRATRLLDRSLQPGRYVAGTAVLCGQRADTSIIDLPSAVTVAQITSLIDLSELEEA